VQRKMRSDTAGWLCVWTGLVGRVRHSEGSELQLAAGCPGAAFPLLLPGVQMLRQSHVLCSQHKRKAVFQPPLKGGVVAGGVLANLFQQKTGQLLDLSLRDLMPTTAPWPSSSCFHTSESATLNSEDDQGW
jgi:hypothetical protein